MTIFSRSIRLGKAQKSRRGFTLIEILVVIVIIAILAGTVGPMVMGRISQARSTSAKDAITTMATALKTYNMDNGHYPTTQQGLEALIAMPTIDPPSNWRGPYIDKNAVPLDPWGHTYYYESPGTVNPGSFDLFSLGKDGQTGGEETDPDNADITSWN